MQDQDLHDHKRARHLYPGGAADVYGLILLFESWTDCFGIARTVASKCSNSRAARLLRLILVNLSVSSEASARAYTMWPELQRGEGEGAVGVRGATRRVITLLADCTIIYAAALHTYSLCSTA